MIAAATPVLQNFWANRPGLFRAVEAKFNLAHPQIERKSTSFEHVISAHPPEIAAKVSDIIIDPDPIQPYTKLKNL